MVMKNVRFSIQKIPYLFLLMLFSCVTAMAQQGITVKGTVFDSTGETVIGASVVVKGNTSIGTISDIDGNFVDEHALTSTISRIRSKIEKPDHAYIKTVYGMGYMWIGGSNK